MYCLYIVASRAKSGIKLDNIHAIVSESIQCYKCTHVPVKLHLASENSVMYCLYLMCFPRSNKLFISLFDDTNQK